MKKNNRTRVSFEKTFEGELKRSEYDQIARLIARWIHSEQHGIIAKNVTKDNIQSEEGKSA